MIYAARRRNESYPQEKYTFEIDTRPELIVSDRATNTRETSMWRRSMSLLEIPDHRDRLDALNDEFESRGFLKTTM